MAHKILSEFPDKLKEVMKYILKDIQETAVFEKLSIEFYGTSGELITSYIDEKGTTRGPNSEIDFTLGNEEMPFHTITYAQAEIWPIIAAIALCCVKASVGSNGWSVGFDCNCLIGKTSVSINNKKFDVSRIQFVPLNSSGQDVQLDCRQWTVSAK